MFGIVCHQNKNKSEDLKTAIINTCDHIFNMLEKCGKWCRYEDPDNYNSKYLEHPLGEHAGPLFVWVKETLAVTAGKANRLAFCGCNESMKTTIASKNSKARHYGGLSELNTRVDAAVCQKNSVLTTLHASTRNSTYHQEFTLCNTDAN